MLGGREGEKMRTKDLFLRGLALGTLALATHCQGQSPPSSPTAEIPVLDPTGAEAEVLSSRGDFTPIVGFPAQVNDRLRQFFIDTADHPGRKIAVFDVDGTLFQQVPHYLADECLYSYVAKHPERKAQLIKKMISMSNVENEYVQARIRYLAGMTAGEVVKLGEECFKRDKYQFYPPMVALVNRLKQHGFEVWPITASPQLLYQGFVAEVLELPMERVIGVKSVVGPHWVVTNRMVRPVPQDEGKAETIFTFIEATPLFAAGNSRGDFDMIEASEGFKLVVNPDDTKHKPLYDGMTLKGYAENHGWAVVHMTDLGRPDFPSVSSKKFGMRKNHPEPGPKLGAPPAQAPTAPAQAPPTPPATP